MYHNIVVVSIFEEPIMELPKLSMFYCIMVELMLCTAKMQNYNNFILSAYDIQL